MLLFLYYFSLLCVKIDIKTRCGEKYMYDLAIIGGGVSGLTAAAVAINRGLSVLILEFGARVGQKLLITGNGKANLSNTNMSAERYNDIFVCDFLQGSQKVYDFFEYIGLKTKVVDGRVYPYSESAAAVLNLLRKKVEKAEIIVNYEVEDISIEEGHFLINNYYRARNCIFCTGSAATKGKNSHNLLQKMGHRCLELKPSIVPLITDTTYIKGLSGLRVKAKLSLICNNKVVNSATGEILFKDSGISGIVSMELSSYIARNSKNYNVSVDFAMDFEEKEIADFLEKNSLEGLLQRALADAVVRQALARKVPTYKVVKDFLVEDVKCGSIKNAQVVCGGLDCEQFDKDLQSRLVCGLYVCGEALNIDGDCGGYNLHWAFLSGIIAGENIC